MVKFTDNQIKIIEKAINTNKFMISRQDDTIRDLMIFEICKLIREKNKANGKILLVFDFEKIYKINKLINDYGIDIQALEIEIMVSNDFVLNEEKLNHKYGAIIIDNIMDICPTTIIKKYEIIKKNNDNSNIIFYATTSSFLNRGVLDVWAFMLLFHEKYLQIMNYRKAENFLHLFVIVSSKRHVSNYFQIEGVKISNIILDKLKKEVGFDDYHDINTEFNYYSFCDEGLKLYYKKLQSEICESKALTFEFVYNYIMKWASLNDDLQYSKINNKQYILINYQYLKYLYDETINTDCLSVPLEELFSKLKLDKNLLQSKILLCYNKILEQIKVLTSSRSV